MLASVTPTSSQQLSATWWPTSPGARTRLRQRLRAVLAELQSKPPLMKIFGSSVQSPGFLAYALGLSDSRGYTPLHYSAAYGAPALTALMFDIAILAHPDLGHDTLQGLVDRREHSCGYTPLHCAVLNRQIEAATVLLEHLNANPTLPDFSGRSPLHMAVQNNDVDTVKLLIQHGANPNQADLDGATPVHIAAAFGNCQIIKVLLQAGGWLGAKDDEGEIPLFYAVREGHIAVAKVLLEAGCDSLCTNDDGETVLDLCIAVGDMEMTKLLQQSINSLTSTINKTNTHLGDSMEVESTPYP